MNRFTAMPVSKIFPFPLERTMQLFRVVPSCCFPTVASSIICLDWSVNTRGTSPSISIVNTQANSLFQRPTNAREYFDLCHAQLRSIVERAIYLLTERFRILTVATEYEMDSQAQLPAALCCIHNIIRRFDPKDVDRDVEKAALLSTARSTDKPSEVCGSMAKYGFVTVDERDKMRERNGRKLQVDSGRTVSANILVDTTTIYQCHCNTSFKLTVVPLSYITYPFGRGPT